MLTRPFDDLIDRIDAGDRLDAETLSELAGTADVLSLGMLADALRRRLHGQRVTYVRVAPWPVDAPPASIESAAREVRLTGVPKTLEDAIGVVGAVRAKAGNVAVSGFSWPDIEQLSVSSGETIGKVLTQLRAAGLDAIAYVPMDHVGSLAAVVEHLSAAGYQRLRLSIDKAAPQSRTDLMREAASVQEQYGCVQAISPLPTSLNALRPTSGYDDVRAVAVARLAVPNVPTIQVDWLRYGPKLAQVGLSFGADDLDNVGADDAAPEGRRRAPLEEVRRNIVAAGFEPAERDGRFVVVA